MSHITDIKPMSFICFESQCRDLELTNTHEVLRRVVQVQEEPRDHRHSSGLQKAVFSPRAGLAGDLLTPRRNGSCNSCRK